MLGFGSTRTAIRMCFAIIGFSLSLWVFRLEEFKVALGLSNSTLSFLLLIAPITMSLTLIQAPRLSRALGLINLLRFGISLSALSVFILSFIPPFSVIFIALGLLGIAAAFFEVGLNTIAQKVDRDSGVIMSSCHGFWSIGFAVGGYFAGYLSENSVSFFSQEIFIVPVIIALTFYFSTKLPEPQASRVEDGGHSWPSLAVLPLCLIPFASLFVEGATADWNTIFLKNERGWRDIDIGIAIGGFMFAMAIARLFGDRLRRSYSAKQLIEFSTVLSLIGICLYAWAQAPLLIILGSILGGFGAGNIYPLAIVLANEGLDEAKSSQVTGSIALVSFNAFLLAPVFMGWVGDLWSLSTAFLLIIPFFLATFIWLKIAKV